MSENRRNPFPGLRPFLFHEHDLFFGREEQHEQMVGKLAATRFLAVVGTSGSGKSSLVRAGLLPALYGGLMMSAGSNWRVALFRPKDDPIRELAQALNHRRVFGTDFKDDGSPLLSIGDVIDWPGLCLRLSDDARETLPSPSNRILELLPHEMRQIILDTAQREDFAQVHKSSFVEAFNHILTDRGFYQPQGFEKVAVPGEARRLLSRGQENLSNSEIQKLNRLILEASYPQEIAKDKEIQTKITEVSLRRGDLGLIETVRQAKMARGENLLVVVDQFEELFRYARISENGPHGNQAAAFVKLLLAARSQKDLPIYVVLTMRSDYLGDCAKFWDLPEAINEGQYLIPRLTRDQRREAIIGPVKKRGARITPQLVNQLLNDMGDSPDQLPILQHALMRTWDKWEKDRQGDEPIDVRHYEAIGKMTEALSRHADEAYAELPDDRSREIARKIFKCLTERGSRNREVRRPTPVREIRAITGAKIREIVAVTDVFRKEGRSFLLPSQKKPLARNTSIDISHESLIRNWARLKEWVREETRAANTYRRLAETAQLYKRSKTSLSSELEVEYALEWRKENNPNLAWASRYHPYLNDGFQKAAADGNSAETKKLSDEEIFKSAISFLEESQRVSEIAKRKRGAKLTRARGAAAVFLALSVACVFLWFKARWSEELTNLMTYMVNVYNAEEAFAQKNYARGYTYLDTLRDSEKYGGMRGFEWDLLTRTCVHDITPTKEGRSAMQHSGRVLAAAFLLPDKKVLATASETGEVKLWEVGSWKELSLRKMDTTASLIAFSLDGNSLASVNGARNEISVSDTYTGIKKQKWSPQGKEVKLITFSPDGKKIASVLVAKTLNSSKGDEQVFTWDLNTNETKQITLDSSAVGPINSSAPVSFTGLAFSGDGKQLAIGCNDGSVKISEGGAPASELPVELDDRSAHTGGEDDASQAKNGIQALAFSKDQRWLVSGNNTGFITLWNLGGKKPKHWQATTDSILSLAYSPDGGILAAASHNGSVMIWDKNKLESAADSDYPKDVESSGLLKGHEGEVLSMAFLPDTGLLATTSEDQTVRLWDTNKREIMEKELEAPAARIVALPPDAGGERFAVQLTDKPSTLEFMRKTSDGFSSFKGQFQAAPSDFTNVASIALYAPQEGKKILSIYRKESGSVRIKLWDMDTLAPLTGKEWIVPLTPTPEPADEGAEFISASKFSDDGKRLATWSPEAGVIIFDIGTGKPSEPILKGHSKVNFHAASFSHDLTVFVESNDKTLSFYDARNGRALGPTKTYDDSVNTLAFSQDDKKLATGRADNTVCLWDTATWTIIKEFKGHVSTVQAIVFSPDGKRLVTGSSDGIIKVWDIGEENWLNNEKLGDKLKRRELVSLPTSNRIVTLAFAWDGKTLISSHANQRIRVVGAN
ncbi:MAG TPA: WD40 repeat domain-containing protein [Pyrinomonadaceae bacterium]|jgi:WD40 repeat protein